MAAEPHPSPTGTTVVNSARVNEPLSTRGQEKKSEQGGGEGEGKGEEEQQEHEEQGEGQGQGKENGQHEVVAEYMRRRAELEAEESAMAFDHRIRQRASTLERCADQIVRELRAIDRTSVYDAAPPRPGRWGQLHPRVEGDHFLSNVDLIERTALFRVACRMPKGAHLHMHFNACLRPDVLIGIAKRMDRMHISSDMALLPDDHFVSYDRCRLQFSILPLPSSSSSSSSSSSQQPLPSSQLPSGREKLKYDDDNVANDNNDNNVANDKINDKLKDQNQDQEQILDNIFSSGYVPRRPMPFRDFVAQFPDRRHDRPDVDDWLACKLVFDEQEAHHWLQTPAGAWDKFNARTQMMKGLFNYETAFSTYARLCLEDLARDNVQYAEIRPNFMSTNQLLTDDGRRRIDNAGIMQILVDTCRCFQRDNPASPFVGIKVIYCTTRAYSRHLVREALDECIAFKKRWPEWIAGFDLVGEEAVGHPLKFFAPDLLAFRRRCAADQLDIPFLFHCGETIDAGSEADGNLLDALLLGARRVGHGVALARHPAVMDRMRRDRVCVELCPISNEVLGLTPRVGAHTMYALLANNIHCAVSADNGTIFRSSLSHDFYQVMVGHRQMSLFGWKQLIEWSLEHACMADEERARALAVWRREWEAFLVWLVDTYREKSIQSTTI